MSRKRLVCLDRKSYIFAVSTVQEIQAAIQSLPEMQRFELMNWLHVTYEEPTFEEEAEMIAEAEEGSRQIREGKWVSLEELRRQAHTWTSK